MKKGLLKVVLIALLSLFFFGAEKASAGHDIGALSKADPDLYCRFTLEKGEEFYGCFFTVKDKATGVKLSIENLSKGDGSLKAELYDTKDGKFDLVRSDTLKKGKKNLKIDYPDFKAGDEYFIQICEASCYDQPNMSIGLCVYSEGLGGSKHDFTKLVISKDEVNLRVGKSMTLKVKSIDKSLKKSGVTWSSSDKKVATVSKKGKVKTKKNGFAVITCTSKKDKNVSAQCVIWVDGYDDSSVVNDDKTFVQSGDIKDVVISEDPFNLDRADRVLYLETNGYSGPLDIEIHCDNGVDTQTVNVEKNKKYRIVYIYDFVNRDDNWENILLGGGSLSLNTKALRVSIKDGDSSGYQKLTANVFNIGTFSMYEEK